MASVYIPTPLDLADLAQGNARSIIARAANTSGVWAELQGGGAGTALIDTGSGLAFSALDVAAVNDVVYEQDFAANAAHNFTTDSNGDPVTIGDLTMTVDNIENAATFSMGASGITCTPPASTVTQYTSSAQTCPALSITLGDLADQGGFTFDPLSRYAFELHVSARTLSNGTDGARMGLFGFSGTPASSNTRFKACDLGNNAGLQTIRTLNDTTFSASGENLAAADVLSVRFDATGTFLAAAGTYSGGWPTDLNTYYIGSSGVTASNIFLNRGVFLVFAFMFASSGSPTSSITLRRFRIRKV